jgi:hypothetical protein
MKKVTIEYLNKNDECKSATGDLVAYCLDGDVLIIDDKNGVKRKGMPVDGL